MTLKMLQQLPFPRNLEKMPGHAVKEMKKEQVYMQRK
jgi:hypothetical protein